jgi:hypothetical protein
MLFAESNSVSLLDVTVIIHDFGDSRRGRTMKKRRISFRPPSLSTGPMKPTGVRKIIATTLLLGLAVASAVYLCVSPSRDKNDPQGSLASVGHEDGLALLNALQGRATPSDDAMPDTMLDLIRDTLGTTREEWRVIEPLLEDALSFHPGRSAAAPSFGRFEAASETETTGSAPEVNPWANVLSRALESESVSLGEMEYILIAFRQERDNARERLRQALTVHQEAQLILLGVLD